MHLGTSRLDLVIALSNNSSLTEQAYDNANKQSQTQLHKYIIKIILTEIS